MFRGLSGKETNLNFDFNRAKLSILIRSDTKNKGQGMIELKKNHILIYSEIQENRAMGGVACVTQRSKKHPTTVERIIRKHFNSPPVGQKPKRNDNHSNI